MSIAMATIMLVSLCAVLSSPSVTAADDSSANAQISAALVGAPVESAPAVCSQSTYSLDLFVQGADHALWTRHWVNGTGWYGWESLSGNLTSAPAAASIRQGVIDVFARGTDGALWSRSTRDGTASWTPWFSLGGQLLPGTGPAAYAYYNVATADTRLGWFVAGTDHALWYAWDDNLGLHNWQSLGGYLTSSPAANAYNNLNYRLVCARGGDGALWQREYLNNAWSSWTSQGGQLLPGTGPATCPYGEGWGTFVIGMNHALWLRQGAQWGSLGTQWGSIGGYLTSSPGATGRVVEAGAYADVFARGRDGALWWRQLTCEEGAGCFWLPWTGPIAGP